MAVEAWEEPRWLRLLVWALRLEPMGPYTPRTLFGRKPTLREAWTGRV